MLAAIIINNTISTYYIHYLHYNITLLLYSSISHKVTLGLRALLILGPADYGSGNLMKTEPDLL